ncbi:MAG: DUF454 domain-containing protein [Aquificae bacterium]|nr:DUF454 domain-containing protein [Aquificota bacterium]
MIVRFVLGFVFLVVGIIGVIFPVLPGIPFLILSAFFFGFLSREKVIKYMKKLKTSDKNSTFNRVINHILIKYVYRKEPIKTR